MDKFIKNQSAHYQPRSQMSTPASARNKSHSSISHSDFQQFYFRPKARFSTRKSIPLDFEVVQQRKQMILSTSKISKDVPTWFKGETYKYFNRQLYNQFQKNQKTHVQNHVNIISHLPAKPLPPIVRSIEPKVHYTFALPSPIHLKRVQRQIAPKIGAIDTRSYHKASLLLKIGKNEYIDTGM